MSLQLSPSINSSLLDHDEHRYLSFPEVEIQSLTDDDCAVKRSAPIPFDNGDLAMAIADAESRATKRHDYLPGRDSLDPISRPTRPTLYVRIEESLFSYFESLSARSNGHSDVSVPRKISATVDQL